MAIAWITAADLDSPGNAEAPSAAETASWILYKLSGEKYAGIRTATEWYGFPGVSCGMCSLLSSNFEEFEFLANHYHATIETAYLSRGIRLRGRPALSIDSIVDSSGVTIDPSQYMLVNNAYVVQRSSAKWSLSQGLTITYSFGNAPPEAGKRAAIKLANELVLSITNPSNCSLPERVTSVSRQGINFEMFDPQAFIENGRVGLYEVDLFLQAANPLRATKRPRVFSANKPKGERYI